MQESFSSLVNDCLVPEILGAPPCLAGGFLYSSELSPLACEVLLRVPFNRVRCHSSASHRYTLGPPFFMREALSWFRGWSGLLRVKKGEGINTEHHRK